MATTLATGPAADPPQAAGFPPAARLRLPDGMTVVPRSRVEAGHVYQELFEKRIYLRHGVTLEPGDCVFDVGGNGTFAPFAHAGAPGAGGEPPARWIQGSLAPRTAAGPR